MHIHNGAIVNAALERSTKMEGEKRMGLGRLMVTLKSKIRCLKIVKKGEYDKVEKSESMRMEIRSRKARKLIEETLKVADSPKSKTFAF
ncbi:hypothetical protein VNO80_13698 [Phaseolus coccineus]|uniref:Uncharacterized protein n=1 Tax=Phaseolus coccineus TaxID=3886 RepID=A0AAN9N1I7_PHACN